MPRVDHHTLAADPQGDRPLGEPGAALAVGGVVAAQHPAGQLAVSLQVLLQADGCAHRLEGPQLGDRGDAGGSHDPAAAKSLLDVQTLTGAEIVVGSRFVPGAIYRGEASPWRPLLSRVAASACNMATGARYFDWTSGYRVFTADALQELLDKFYHARMHGWQIEVLAQANAMGMHIVEWPIEYTAGRSSFNWRVAHEASNSWLHVFFHIGGCTGNKRLSVQQDRSLSETTVTISAP